MMEIQNRSKGNVQGSCNCQESQLAREIDTAQKYKEEKVVGLFVCLLCTKKKKGESETPRAVHNSSLYGGLDS